MFAILIESFTLGWFIIGFLSGIVALFFWRVLRSLIEIRKSNSSFKRNIAELSNDPRLLYALETLNTYRKRLRLQKTPNPRWVQPLVEEIPHLLTDIAVIYYPKAKNPLLAPGISHFARAVQLMACDIADFLEKNWLGRTIDMSAEKVRKVGERVRKILGSRTYRIALKFYRYIRPIVQGLRYKKPTMWIFLGVKNIGIRILQPRIIDIVGHRAIELYSGALAGEVRIEDDKLIKGTKESKLLKEAAKSKNAKVKAKKKKGSGRGVKTSMKR